MAKPYSGIAGLYDRVLGDAMSPYIHRSFDLCSSAYNLRFNSVADVGCGTGTFLKYISQKNNKIQKFGVDKSASMLQIAKKKNAGKGIRFFCQDIVELCLPNKVDLITCNGDTLNYLTEKKYLSRAIDACNKNLNKGGCFMFDIIAGGRCSEDGETIVQDIALGNARSIWTITTDFAGKMSISDILTCFHKNDGCTKTIRELHIQRWYGVPLVSRILKQCGFSLRDVIEADTLRRATPDSFWVKFIAVKK